jgi:lipopolysaccharide biosynthesis glycosyltransferase
MVSVNVVFTTDLNYLKITVFAVKNFLLLNNSKTPHFNVYLLVLVNKHEKIELEIKGVKIVSITDDDILKFKVSHHISHTAYARIFIPDYIDILDYIYFDSDIIFRDKLKISDWLDFIQTDCTIGAVFGEENNYEYIERMKNIDVSIKKIFNSGVLFVKHCDFVAYKRFKNQITEINRDYYENILWHDQDLLNFWSLKHQSIFEIDFKYWNYIIKLHGYYNSPVVVHYSGEQKPWHAIQLNRVNLNFWWVVFRVGMQSELNFLYKLKRLLFRITPIGK